MTFSSSASTSSAVSRGPDTAWLLRGDMVLASVEIADSFRARARGLLGRDSLEGALLIHPARSVHTFRMQFDIDVAFCDADMVVLGTVRLRRNRISRPRLRARSVLEAKAGAFEQWGLQSGDQLVVETGAGDE